MGRIFVRKNVSSDKIFVTSPKFRKFCPTIFCPKFCLAVIHVLAVFWTKTNKDATETFLQEAVVEISKLWSRLLLKNLQAM